MEQVPAWIVYVVGISNLVLCVGILVIAVVLALMAKQIISILTEIQKMVTEDVRKDLMPSITGTLKNVEKISTDAADTTHNVTAAANRVSNLVGSAANRLESPVIKAVGLASGVLAASRSIRGQKTVVVEDKKKKKRFPFG
jgi:predicted PurR-regulated permease PerM